MNKVRIGVLLCLFFILLSIPTSSFATNQNNSYSQDDGFIWLITNFFVFFQTDKEIRYTNYDEEKYFNNITYYSEKNEDDSFYIGDKKVNKKDWEKYLNKKKRPQNCEKESRDIWRKWFCYDDGWDDDDCNDDDDDHDDEDDWWKRWH